MEAVFRKKLPGYQSSVQLLQNLSFEQAIRTNLPNVSVELSGTEGVLFIGAADDLIKAEQLLAEFLSNVQTSDSQWKLDRYKVKLLYAKETRQFLMDEFVRQDIECHFTFDENTELVRLFAQSVYAIGRAESVLEKCICVMKVSQNDPLISSARKMSLLYSGKCMLIDEKEEKLFVFTCDIEDAVNMGRQKELELGSEELDTEEIIEVTCAEYKSSVQLLKCLSFADILARKLPNVNLILDLENGVILKGVRAEVNKANSMLTHFLEEVKTSGPDWKLDIHKAQLLKVKVVQNNLQGKMHRQGLKCYMAFQKNDESLKIYALSEADIRKAHYLIDESICVMEVPLNDRFLVSEASDLCLEFAGSIIQIAEHDTVVFVFTSDIEIDVKAANDRAYSPGDELDLAETDSGVKNMCATDNNSSSEVGDYGHAKLKAKCIIDTKPSTAGYIGNKNISSFENAKNEHGPNTSDISDTSDTNHNSKTKLSETTHDSNRLIDGLSAELAPKIINIKMNYFQKEFGKKHGNSLFEYPKREPNQGTFCIHDVEQRIYHLLKLGLKEDGKALDRKIKYNRMSSELCVNGDRDTYMFISERINTLKTYTSDSIETTHVEQRQKINKSIDDVKGDFPELIVDVSESEIHIHGPSEVVQKAKHKLKVLLGLVKTTARARRSIADEAFGVYSPLQPSVSEKCDPGTELRSQYQSVTETRRLHNDDHRKSYRLQKGSTHPVTFSTTENLIVKVYKGSITDLKVDCIVYTANEGLVHAGGVAGGIARAAGKQFEKESEDYVYRYGKVKVTECVATGPGNLRYEYIIHAVGPRWDTDKNKDKCRNDLLQTVLNCLVEADKLRMKSVAIPLISAGISGMPKEICAEQYGRGVNAFSSSRSHEHLKEIHFVDIQDDIIHVIQSVFSNVFLVISDDDIRSRQVQEECNNDNRASQQETYQHYTDIASGAEKENEPFSTREHQIPNRPYEPGHGNTSVTNQLKRHSSATHERSNSPETEHGLLHKKAVPRHQEIRKPNEDVSPPSNRQAAPPINRQAVPPVPGHQEIRKPNEDVSPPSNRQAAPPSNRQAVPPGNRQTAPQGYRQEPKQTPNRQEPTTVPTTDVSDRSAVSTARASTRTAYAVPVDGTISKLTVHGDRHNPYIFYPLHTEQFSIHVYRHDISMLSVDAVVSIEDKFCRGEGIIAQAINKVCGPAYTVQHKQMKNANLKLTAAHLTTSGEGPTFRYVIHSVAPRWNKYSKRKDLHQYKKLLKTTIGNILQLTRTNKDIGTIGIPLLGVGDETTNVDVCCQVVIGEIMDFCADRKSFPGNLTQIHLIDHDGGVVFALKEFITAALDVKPAFTDQAEWKKVTKKRDKNQPKHKNSSQGTPV